MKENQKTWRRLADPRVRHVWKATCACATKGATMVGGEVSVPPATVRVPPTFYEASGTPVCPECGAEMSYSHTEVRLSKRTTKPRPAAGVSEETNDERHDPSPETRPGQVPAR